MRSMAPWRRRAGSKMFSDPRARALWRRYHLRATYALGAVAGPVRRELLDDLASHVAEALNATDSADDEYNRLAAILQRLGEPKEFLAQLISDAILKHPGPPSALEAARDAIFGAWRLGSALLAVALAYPILAIAGAALTTLAFMRAVAPDIAGVFALAPDDYQVRILSSLDGGEQVMPLWVAALLFPLGLAIVVWTIARVRALALSLVLGAPPR